MRKFNIGFVLFALTAMVSAIAAAASPVDGSWEGKLQSSGVSLRIVFNISSADDGSLKATMDSPDQGAYGIGVDTVTLVDNTLRCQIKGIRGEFEGKFKDADRTIDGYWTQFGVPLPLSLKPKAATVRKRPQEPVKPYPYVEEEVAFENAKAGVKFAGTLTKPSQGKRLPAVVLISGSGPQDRDGEIMGHKPFHVWADYLTRRGVAVLRVDDRGVGGTTRGARQATTEDHAQDALAAVAYLRSRRDVDKKRIGLVGHSEGGLIAPLAVVQSKHIAFIVLLGAPGARGVDVVAKQRDAMMAARGVPESLRALGHRIPDRLAAIAMESPDTEHAMAKFDEYWAELRKQSAGPFVPTEAEADLLNMQADAAKAELRMLTSPWMRFFLTYDPAPTLREVRVPVLAINGSLDTQVVASQNLPLIEAALKAGGNKDYTVRELAGLNHLLQAANTGAPSEYVEIEETINPEALTIVGEWIDRHVRR